MAILSKLPDGTPPPPKLLRGPLKAPGQAQRSNVYVLDDRTLTMTRIRPGDATPIPKVVRPPAEPPRKPTEAELREYEELAKRSTFFTFSATVYDHEVSFLRWRHGKARYSCWSNMDASLLSGLGDFRVRGHHYSFFMGIGVVDRGRQHVDPDQWPGLPPEMPSWPPQFELVGEEPERKAALAPIIALHELYAVEHKKLVDAYEGRERYRKEREAWLKANPPIPPQTTVFHWPGAGGDVLQELPPPSLGIVGGREQTKPFRRFGQISVPRDPAARAALRSRTRPTAEDLKAARDEKKDGETRGAGAALEVPDQNN